MSETTTTSATYDRIAGDYARRWASGEVLAPARERFAALLARGALVLDVGCGPGHDAALLAQYGLRLAAVDRSRKMLELARHRTSAPLLQADMRHLPFAAAALDALWASASFLHIPKRDAAEVLREFRRALRPGGLLYMGVKQGDGERWVENEAGLKRFFTFYREDELDALLRNAGFQPREGWVNDDSLGREPWINRIVALAQASEGAAEADGATVRGSDD